MTRVENVVVTIDYNGAGLAGDKTPSARDLTKDAQKAAKEAVAAVVAANGGGRRPAGRRVGPVGSSASEVRLEVRSSELGLAATGSRVRRRS